MKKALNLLTLAVALSLASLSSCKTDDTDNLSVIRTYPLITLKGPSALSVNVGSVFNDEGVTAVLGSAPVTARVRGSVNTAVPGAYTLVYTAKNPEGDSVSVTRLVGVVDAAVNGLDLSGNYLRSSNMAPVTVTKLGNGFYQTNNLGGNVNPAAGFAAYFFHLTPTTVLFPPQVIPGIGATSFDGQTAAFDAAGNIINFSYIVINPGFLNNRRTYVKQ